MTDARVRRGRETEHLQAEYLLPLFPDACAVGNSLPGRDILNTPGIAPEVKARTRFEPKKAMEQAKKNAGEDMPMVVLRLPGQGEAQIDDWLIIFRNRDARELIGRAFNLGEYRRTSDYSPPEEPSKGFGSGETVRVGSNSDHSRHAVLSGILSSFLHDLGILANDEQVQVCRRKG